MERRTQQPDVSPYRVFSRAEWATLRADTPMTLEPAEIARLRSMHDRLDMSVVAEIYLPLSRLLSLYVAATQRLFRAQQRFLVVGCDHHAHDLRRERRVSPRRMGGTVGSSRGAESGRVHQ